MCHSMLKAGPPSLSWHVKYSLTYRKVIAGLRTQKTTRQERTMKPYEREGGREREREREYEGKTLDAFYHSSIDYIALSC